ncbi:MAG TPA: methyltransferase domain-containing protein [Oscillatoriaceae cyanobacterium M33_DOE_052]|uniref:Class I SAM-dependent methyltransferase n=1 Tax=Planktothricoides sp. SpSt-374 TaxID=2282167 RepID=A0A7C3VG49_9CYAN|nr:methyltransferase domain-containing protein [Oscillatoriaceae cyanobacterium M33_DOE_052]
MAPRKDTIFQRFLAPAFELLIDGEQLKRLSQSIDWNQAVTKFGDSENFVYPEYYRSQNFHGIEGGYLTRDAAVTYDAITQYVLPPGETLVRQGLIDAIRCQPTTILDLGCGTGSTTIMLKKAFPRSWIVGLDLSPYMLAVAEHKAKQAGLDILWLQGKAEATRFATEQFDLVTASLLFHETPPTVTRAILKECFRLLKPGGEVAILDGNQKSLRQVPWLTEIFEEPYIKDYAGDSVDAGMGAAGFAAVLTEELWWLHQVTLGVKPLAARAGFTTREDAIASGDWMAAPGY